MRFPQATYVDGLDRWPVGSVFVSLTNDNPADLLGFGVWQSVGAGRVLVGLDAGQTEFDALEKTGGVKDVTLTAAQSGLPAHSHVQTVNSATTGGTSGYTPDTSTNNGVASGYSTQQNTAAPAAQAHTNLQPYLVARFWRRTA